MYPGADVYLEGHPHTYDFYINKVQYVDRERNNLVEFPAYFCTTGHCLKWKDSYGEDKKYIPSVEGIAILGFKPGGTGNFARKKVTGDLFY